MANTTSRTSTRASEPPPTRRTARATRIFLWSGAAVLLMMGLLLTIPIDPEWWKVVVLGVVEGITEFLPISSTGHLLVAAQALDFKHNVGGTFEIFIQLGAVVAVVGYYFRDLLTQVRDFPRSRTTQRFWLAILVAFMPAAVIGLAVHKVVKEYLFRPEIIAATLIIGGVIFIVAELLPRREKTLQMERVSWPQALGIGVAQTLALVPGVSRSGAAILGGMFGGLDRRTATAFSFYLAIPTLGAATVADLVSSLGDISSGDLGRLFLGAVVSMIVAWLSIDWLLRYVAHHSFIAFGIYRILAGLAIIGLLAMNFL